MTFSKIYKKKHKIIEWLNKYNITKYNLVKIENFGYVVDVAREVNLTAQNLKYMPVNFRNVDGNFYCNKNNLENLDFAPFKVSGVFDCSNNKLKSLTNSPKHVARSYHCQNNELETLEGLPEIISKVHRHIF